MLKIKLKTKTSLKHWFIYLNFCERNEAWKKLHRSYQFISFHFEQLKSFKEF